MRIAMYKNLKNNFTLINDAGSPDDPSWINDHNSYIRLTTYQEVEFIDLPPEETVPQEINALNEAKTNAHNQYLVIAASIDDKISKLQAITHEVAE